MVAGTDAAALPRLPILPPFLAMGFIGVMAALHAFAPGLRLVEASLTRAGWVPIALGIGFAVAARRQFVKADTTIKPFHTSSALVTHGVFALSRNPMYTSLTAALVGVFVLLGTLTPGLVIPVFVWIIRTRVIAVEEAMLEETFGDEYRAYKSRVRRWL